MKTRARRAAALLALLLLAQFPLRAQEAVQPPKVEGMWLGTLKVQGVEARIGFIIQTKDGLLIATLESIDQNKRGVPVKEVSVKDGTVRLANKALYFSYEGKISKDGNEIVGEFALGEMKLPLTLKRVDKLPGVNRPQEPKPPFPYRE